MKLLGAVRLSRATDESTSPKRQAEQITLTAQARRDELVALVEDLDVSGAADPFERESLGPWLTDPGKIGQWDGLIVAKLDGLTRSLLEFQRILIWCRQHGDKTIISVSEGIDFSTPTGKLLANVIIMFAEFERERIGERRGEAAAKLRRTGRWGGGQVPFGYRPVKVGDGGWTLEPDPGTSEVVSRITDMMIKGASLSAASRWLEDHGIPTPRESNRRKGSTPYRWTPATVRKLLRSKSLRGEVTHQGQVVRGADGHPVRFEPLIDAAQWDQLQQALDTASKPQRGERGNGSMLLRIAFCGRCGRPLYQTQAGNGTRYYRCASRTQGHPCGEPLTPVALLDSVADEAVLETIGAMEITERSVVVGDDQSRALAEVGQAITDLTSERYVRGIIRDDFDPMLASLQAEHARLGALPAEPSEVVERGTGVRVAERWAELDAVAKGGFLRKHEVTLDVRHIDDASAHDPDLFPFSGPDTMTFIGNRLRIKVKGWTGLRDAVQELAAATS